MSKMIMTFNNNYDSVAGRIGRVIDEKRIQCYEGKLIQNLFMKQEV